MSRIRTGHQPGDWKDEGPASPYVVRRQAGELVQGKSGGGDPNNGGHRKPRFNQPQERAA